MTVMLESPISLSVLAEMPSSARAEPATQTSMATIERMYLLIVGVVSKEKGEVCGGRSVERTSRQNYVVLTRRGLPRVTDFDIRQGQKLRQLLKHRRGRI